MSLAHQAFSATQALIADSDPEIAGYIAEELANQRRQLKFIASENYASPAVLAAMGNWLSDKYAEGTPGRRFYAGCEIVDKVETAANERAKELFGAQHAYSQPHSGIDANLVAYWAILSARVEAPALEEAGVKQVNAMTDEDWDKLRHAFGNQRLMGMSLDAGGHLTHGFRPNISGKMFDQRSYGVDPETGTIDYDALRQAVIDFKPLVLVAGFSAYPGRINFATMRSIADEVGAVLMVDMAHFAGLVAGGVFEGEYHPVPYADIVTTTTHKSLRGPRGGLVLCTDEFAPHVDRGCPMVLGGPMAHVMAAKAVCFGEALKPEFKAYARQIVKNAKALADGLTARGAKLTMGGTENHLMVLDTQASYGLNGRQAEQVLLKAGVVCNRNSVPNDPQGAWYTSGVRLGTPAVTTLGMTEADMDEVVDIIDTALRSATPGERKATFDFDDAKAKELADRAAALLAKYPLYEDIQI